MSNVKGQVTSHKVQKHIEGDQAADVSYALVSSTKPPVVNVLV